MVYTYWDYTLSGERVIRRTHGVFIGWTEAGVFGFTYAQFKRKTTTLLVPERLLTRETREAIRGG